MKIFDQIHSSFKENNPFVVYRKPKQAIVSGFFLENDTIYTTTNFTEKGFVFAPFHADEAAILFPSEGAKFYTEKINLKNEYSLNTNLQIDKNTKEKHVQLVEKTINAIKNSELQKVVISRKEILEVTDFNILEIYQKLLQTYANAFVYVWYHPKVGLWFGATPETLLQTNGYSFKTMSLAGTQIFVEDTESSSAQGKNVIWKSKELEEQQLVTNFIEQQLKEISSNLVIDKTETIKAGNLLHLRTKLVGILNNNSSLKELIRALHPTPAVCGLPREKAKEFIFQNENYNRSFYTGFLGELNISETRNSNLFVNLRCMEVEKNTISIYVGGGITKDSNAEKEWEETASKSMVMKKIL